jgi:hypothetical protein
MEDPVHPCDRIGQAGRFGQIADGHLVGAAIPGDLCPLLVTDQGTHRNTPVFQFSQDPPGMAPRRTDH